MARYNQGSQILTKNVEGPKISDAFRMLKKLKVTHQSILNQPKEKAPEQQVLNLF